MKKERKIITIPKTQIQRVWKNGKVLTDEMNYIEFKQFT